MDFARQQRDPTRHVLAIAFVVVLHVLVICALFTGFARETVEVIKKPIDVKIIEEIKVPPLPPPPPRRVVQRPQRAVAAPQPYVPPPDTAVATTQPAPTITAVTTVAPTEPYVIAPPAPVVEAPPPPNPAVRRGIARIAGADPTYPREAIRAGIAKGHVVVRLHIDEKGHVVDVRFVESAPPRVFDRVVSAAVKDWRFHAEGEQYVVEVEFNFTLKDE